ncbi:MAG: hypothetical protein LYZ66_04085 [Nitrososphaerales archaeon]|nr:hypothetical protein [Nitrososphaerales archaeon]
MTLEAPANLTTIARMYALTRFARRPSRRSLPCFPLGFSGVTPVSSIHILPKTGGAYQTPPMTKLATVAAATPVRFTAGIASKTFFGTDERLTQKPLRSLP